MIDIDKVRSLLAQRGNRRRTIGWGVAATSAAAVAAMTGVDTASAQEGTPEASGVTGVEDKVMYLFVQAFHNGSWRPGAEDGTFTLTLNGGLASTVYFSDRPERVYGATLTERFLDGLGFTPDNPPNAALVVNSDGVADILVIELMDPVYDAGAQTLTYTARVLEAYHETGLEYLAVQQADQSLPQEFGAGALFIDDCDNSWISCRRDGNVLRERWLVGFCWHYGPDDCSPCRDYCNQLVPECEGHCQICTDGRCWYWTR